VCSSDLIPGPPHGSASLCFKEPMTIPAWMTQFCLNIKNQNLDPFCSILTNKIGSSIMPTSGPRRQ
jgi:hypothetical protein